MTLATLENRLSGIRHLVVRPGTVVTPSARDAFREPVACSCPTRQLKLAAAVTTLVLGMAELGMNEKKNEVAAFVDALAREGLHVEQLAAIGMASVVSELADHARCVAVGRRYCSRHSPRWLYAWRTVARVCAAWEDETSRAYGERSATWRRTSWRSTRPYHRRRSGGY